MIKENAKAKETIRTLRLRFTTENDKPQTSGNHVNRR